MHVHRLYINCIFTGERWYRRTPGTRALLNAEAADIQWRPTRENGSGEEVRGSLLGREVGSRGYSSLGRSGPPEDGPGQPGAAVHTQLSAVLLGLRPNSPLAALSGHQGPGKKDREASLIPGS